MTEEWMKVKLCPSMASSPKRPTEKKMTQQKTVNAKITYAMFGPEDHDILTFVVGLEWEGGGQGLGGYALDGWNPKTGNRDAGYGPGLIAMKKIMEIAEVRDWSKLPGKLVRAKVARLGSAEPPIIGNIIKDEWFDLKLFMEDHRRRSSEDPRR